MCGIAGFNWDNKDLIKAMTSVVEHRGPDGFGYYSNKQISLGHRRLSIIDLSSAGKQPMCNEDETVWITYNGEIYNFSELRVMLEQKGHRFSSNTDTEVIIHGYEEWGAGVVEKLNGMFAFAVWDENEKLLFLARDRLGIKPLYYYWDGNKFIFASEIKSILQEPSVKRIVNRKAAYNYLNLRYVPGEATLFQGINKLLPGHILLLKDKQINSKRFWNVPFPGDKEEHNVKKLLENSVQRRLIADVPIGAYLSGGIDSAAIVALTANITNEPVRTFSVGFNADEKVDELHKAKVIAEHIGTDHQEIVIEEDEKISSVLPKLIWHFDMPHGDPVIIPMFKLSEQARKKVKVVLTGEGADELFGGYVQYKTMLNVQKGKYIPQVMARKIAQKTPVKVLDRFFDYPSSIGDKGKEKLLSFLEQIKKEPEAYYELTSITSKEDRKFLFSQTFQNDKGGIHYAMDRQPSLNRMLYHDTKQWLPNYPLYVNDRMTMANSIEGRVPFLDHNLVEHAASLHSKLKINSGINKVALRQAIQEFLPKEVAQTKKHAFLMPLDAWHKQELRPLAEQLFTPAKVRERGYFSHYHLEKVWKNYANSKLLYGKQLFTLINFELWHRMFIDKQNISIDGNYKLSSLL